MPPAHSPARVRHDVTVEHFSRRRSMRLRKWTKRGDRDRAQKRRTSDRRSNCRSCPGASSPWTDRWGPFYPCLGRKLSSLIGLCAPWRHRAAGVTCNFKHAELWFQSVDWYSPHRADLILGFWGLPNFGCQSYSSEISLISLYLLTLPIWLPKGKWFKFFILQIYLSSDIINVFKKIWLKLVIY